MCSRIAFFFLLLFSYLTAGTDPCFVFVHIGPRIPPYAEIALLQTRCFNPTAPIYFVGNKTALETFKLRDPDANITFISCESLPKTDLHNQYLARTNFRPGFLRFASERFFYVQDLMNHFQLHHVFHLENDVMLYVDINQLLPTFKKHYRGIAAPFNRDWQCIPGFVYIPNRAAMRNLTACFAEMAGTPRAEGAWGADWNDMEILAYMRRKKGKEQLDMLPTVIEAFAQQNPLANARGYAAKDPSAYYRFNHAFGGIFDAAAIGQFLGGLDPRHDPKSRSYINKECVFNASRFTYVWEEDDQGRKIPYQIYEDHKTPIFNLHLHCKRLHLFTSKPFGAPP